MPYTLSEWWLLLAWSAVFGFGFALGLAVANTIIGLLKRN
jgi:hypothetical protein